MDPTNQSQQQLTTTHNNSQQLTTTHNNSQQLTTTHNNSQQSCNTNTRQRSISDFQITKQKLTTWLPYGSIETTALLPFIFNDWTSIQKRIVVIQPLSDFAWPFNGAIGLTKLLALLFKNSVNFWLPCKWIMTTILCIICLYSRNRHSTLYHSFLTFFWFS